MSNNNQHIPSGYKPSPLGIIPEDWEVKRLGEIGDFSKGNGVPKDKIIKDEHGHPCLTYGDLYTKYDFVIKDMKSFIDDDVASESKEIHIGDICFAGSGETPEDIGKCAAYIEERTAYAGGDIIILSPNKDINGIWLSYVLNSDIGGKQRYKFAQGFSIVHIYPDNLKRIQIPTPTLKEQQRIVSVLSLWDTAITKQTALIEQLTLRKRGLIQQLLTGKKRLKGFEGEWKEVRMQDLASFAGGGTPSTKRSDFWEGTIPWISSSDLVEDCLTNNESRYITEEAIANSTTQLLPSKSILIVTRVGVGKVAIAKHPICVSQDFTCLTKYDADTLFLAYSLLLTMKKKKSQSQGTSIKGISTDEISKIKLLLPSIEEQKAIASVLVNADKEIEKQNKNCQTCRSRREG